MLRRISPVLFVWILAALACSMPGFGSPTAAPLPSVTPATLETTPPEIITPTVELPVTPQPANPTPTTAATGKLILYQGVSFSLPESWTGGDSQGKIVPAEKGEPGAIGWVGPAPEYFQFTFSGYPLASTFHRPTILVYPVKEYAKINPPVAEISDKLKSAMDTSTVVVEGAFGQGLPFLPMWNAAQVFSARQSFFPFQNGRGLRYLTAYAQAIMPVDNSSLFYTYQGLTADGLYYVVGIFPITHSQLESPDNLSAFAGLQQTGDVQKYQTYLNSMINQIEGWNANEFTPRLDDLDAMMRSVSVNPTVTLKEPDITPQAVDCPGAMASRIQVNMAARVTFTDGKPLNVRKSPGKGGEVVARMAEGTKFTIVDGPSCTDQRVWWKIYSPVYAGWVMEGEDGSYFIEPAP